MHKFAKKQIALAVSASLFGGAAMAAATNFTTIAGATQSALAITPTVTGTGATDATAAQLYDAAGTANEVAIVLLSDYAQFSGSAGGAGVYDTTAIANNADATINDIIVKQGGTAIADAQVSNATVVAAAKDYLELTITPAGGAKVRIDGATGKLQYSVDGTVANFKDVTIETVVATTAANAMSTDGDPANPFNALAAKTVYASSDFVNGTVTIKSNSATGASLVNGLLLTLPHEVKTAPVVAATDTVGTTNELALKVNTTGAPITVADATNISSMTGATVTVTAVTAGTAYSFTVDGTKVNWVDTATPTAAADATDAAAYASTRFNTGVADANIPFELAYLGGADTLQYKNIFNSITGVEEAIALPGQGAYTDGAAPVLVSAVTDTAGQAAGTTKLSLTFSEPLKYINSGTAVADAGDLREVAENVKLGADTLAALNLNSDGTLALLDITTTAGQQGVMAITGIKTADITGKTVTVGQGISVKESNDAGYVAATAALDGGPTTLSGGVTTAANEFLSSAATATTAEPLTIAFNSADTSASAATTVADATKVGTITVKFAAGKEVALNATAPAKTMADLAADLVVTVQGLAAQTPVQWQFHPVAADLALSTAGDTLTITLPTALIYSKIDPGALTGMRVGYLNTAQLNVPVANVLVGKASATTIVTSNMVDAFDGEPVILPLSATATSKELLTQSISGTLTGATNGSLVHAHLMKWQETPTTNPATYSITSGRISDPGDKVATDLAIQYTATGGGQQAALQNAIATSLNAVAAAKPAVPGVSEAVPAGQAAPIPVYVQLVRSSDVQANTKGKQNYKEARAILSTLANDAAFYANTPAVGPAGATDVHPVYMAMLNPATGAISGRLTGQLTTKRTAGTVIDYGPIVVAMDVAQGLVDSAGKFNLIVATEPSTGDIAKGLKGLADYFVILVHEDQANTRKYTQLTSANKEAATYLPYEPNLYSLSGTRTVLGVAPGNAGKFVASTAAPSASPILLSNQKVVTLTNSTKWQLFNMGAPAGVGGHAGPRAFVGIDSGTGDVLSFWTNEGVGNDPDTSDMAFAMAGNKVGVSTELLSGATLSTISPANFVAGAATLAFKNGVSSVDTKTLTYAQGAPVTAKVGPGWSLASVPTAGLNATTVEAVLRVGAQSAGDVTWFKADGGSIGTSVFPAGTPVFVYSKVGGNL